MTISAVAGILVFLLLLVNYVRGRELQRKLDAIPTIGSTGPFAFMMDRWKYFRNARGMFQEGYDKYRGSVYKVRGLNQWMVAIASPKLIEDLRKIPDEYFSPQEAVDDLIAMQYTLGKPIYHDPYHIPVVKGALTRNIAVKFSEVRDEIVTAFSELLPPQDDWVPIKLNPLLQKVICRASNRLFVGLPLCQNEDYIDLNVGFTIRVILSGQIINLFPDFLRPIAGDLFSPVPKSVKRATQHLIPLIQERFAKEEEYDTTDWPGKPVRLLCLPVAANPDMNRSWKAQNDFLSWLLEEAKGPRRDIKDLVMRVLTMNFAAIHTTSMTLTCTLNYLCLYPQYIDELRAEIEFVTEEHGWTKVAMGQMRKLDSFLREVQRYGLPGCFGIMRKVMKDYTLSDGTTVPAGVTVGIPIRAVHRDDTYYPDANTFNGFRFSDMRKGDGESLRHQMVTPATDFFLFGHGRHMCPGRFFAVNELKALVAHILLTYDIRVEREGGAEMILFGASEFQDNNIKFLFRKRCTDP